MKNVFKKNLFTILTQFLIIVLPFYVLLSVFLSVKVGIPKAGFFIKELVIVGLVFSLIYEFWKNKKTPKLETIDCLIIGYISYGILITAFNGLGINSIIYGGRYDFIFFIIFLIYKHGKQFLTVNINSLIKLFMISASASLLFGVMIKFRLGESTLVFFGFVDYVSNWTYMGSIPNYHGLENSGIKRFQGILDGPNGMAYFLILYTSIFLHNVKKKAEFHIVLFIIFIFSLFIMTYSRSALLGVFSGVGLLFLLNIKKIYSSHKKQFLILSTILIIFISGFVIIFNEKIENIFLRTSSTKGHFDRMAIGIDRFIEKPLGAGLAEAGPAFRNIYKDKQNKKDEEYYIPESWFIQQLIEGGFIYFLLFSSIFYLILSNLYIHSKSLFVGLIGILVMNVFLHIFEATYLSVLLFIFIGLIYSKD